MVFAQTSISVNHVKPK